MKHTCNGSDNTLYVYPANELHTCASCSERLVWCLCQEKLRFKKITWIILKSSVSTNDEQINSCLAFYKNSMCDTHVRHWSFFFDFLRYTPCNTRGKRQAQGSNKNLQKHEQHRSFLLMERSIFLPFGCMPIHCFHLAHFGSRVIRVQTDIQFYGLSNNWNILLLEAFCELVQDTHVLVLFPDHYTSDHYTFVNGAKAPESYITSRRTLLSKCRHIREGQREKTRKKKNGRYSGRHLHEW